MKLEAVQTYVNTLLSNETFPLMWLQVRFQKQDLVAEGMDQLHLYIFDSTAILLSCTD